MDLGSVSGLCHTAMKLSYCGLAYAWKSVFKNYMVVISLQTTFCVERVQIRGGEQGGGEKKQEN